jgi:ceramide glucosyltransferase
VTYVLFLAAVIAACYQLLALIACLIRLFTAEKPLPEGQLPAVSILKPVYGRDPQFYDAIRSHALQEGVEFELLFGVRSLDDPAVVDVRRLQQEFPSIPIRLIEVTTTVPNAKVASLIDLAKQARHPIVLINDSDIQVPAEYLRRVVAPLRDDEKAGLVTCLYRAEAGTWPARFEALGIATDFAPSTLAAPFVGVNEFALGSTIAMRAVDLEKIGGFEAIGAYIADDYQLGKRITQTGKRCVLSEVVVATHLGGESWASVWRHQLRWARTIRASRFDGYIGLPVTFASFWALLALAAGEWWLGLPLLLLRYAMGLAAARVLHSPDAVALSPLIPIRDLWGAAIWFVGLFGRAVEWRGRRLILDSEGRILDQSK